MLQCHADIGGPANYIDFGGTGTPIVLVHGLGGSNVNWFDLGPRLAKRGNVLAPDLPGFGDTPLAGRSPTVGGFAEFIRRFIEEVAGGSAIVVGNSLGGLISLKLAPAAPEAVSGLVLINPAVPTPRYTLSPIAAVRIATPGLPGIGPLLMRLARLRLPPETYLTETLKLVASDPDRVSPSLKKAAIAQAERRLSGGLWADAAFSSSVRSMARTMFPPSRWRRMHEAVEAPTLLIHGLEDRLVPLLAPETLAAAHPDWETHFLPDVGHVPQMEVPAVVDLLIGSWLAGVET